MSAGVPIINPGTNDPARDAAASAGTARTYARSDHVHPVAPRVLLPDDLIVVVGDTLEIFLCGCIEAPNPYLLPVEFVCSVGNMFTRYYSVTPAIGDVGTKTLTVTVYNYDYTACDTETMSLIVVNATGEPAAQTNVVCIGDSTTAYNAWPQECYRRLTQAAGSPAGLEYGNIDFVGEKALPSYTTQGATGLSGWTIGRFLGTEYTTYGHWLTLSPGEDVNFDKTRLDTLSVYTTGGASYTIIALDLRVSPELVTNGDLEAEWTETNPPNWSVTISAGSGQVVEKETSVVHGGSQAVHLVNSNPLTVNYRPMLSQVNVPVESGSIYDLSFWTRGDGTNQGRFSVQNGDTYAYITSPGYSNTGVAGTSYARVTFRFTVPEGCTKVSLLFFPAHVVSAEAYFDDVSLTLVRPRIKVYGTSALAAAGTLTYSSNGTNTNSIVYSSCTTEPATPFWSSTLGALSFSEWAERMECSTLDVFYVWLGWNSVGPKNYATAADHSATRASIELFVDAIHAEYPSAIVRLLGLQSPSTIGGLGDDYAANSINGHFYAKLRSVNGYNLMLKELVADEDYSGFVRYIAIAPQFDSEWNMPWSDTPVNSRSASTERRGTNGVHPATDGYYQVADAVFRDFIYSFCSD